MIHPSGASPPSGFPASSPSRRPAIAKLLVADRGAVARRILRTAAEMGIATVAVFTEADRDAVFVAEAGEALALDRLSDRGPAAYLDGSALLEAARRSGADAVHPGGGLLARDPGFAWRCAEMGLVFTGPSPEALATLGSRLEAKAAAAAAGVPVLTAEEVDGYPPGKLAAAAEVLGWPVVAKASAAAGGQGLRIVRDGDDLAAAVDGVRRDAMSASGDGTVFLEPWLEPVRRVDVQVFGDATGRVVHLFDRDCSLQRRRRPVVEEAPAPRLSAALRERLHAAAVAVGEAVGYVGAGTAEFLLAGEQLWFLGLEARLAAGHAATEAVLGIDLVRMQLTAAEGRPLPVEARHCSPSGHAVAAHVHAEDPAAGYRPQTGRLRRLEIDPRPGLRVETGVAPGCEFDAGSGTRLATVIAHAATREEAIRRLAAALSDLRAHGLRTNRDQLVAAVRHPAFGAGELDTAFLDRHQAALRPPDGGAEAVRLHAVAAALAGGARPRVTFRGPDGRAVEVTCRNEPDGPDARAGVAAVDIDGVPVGEVRLGAVTPVCVDLEVDGVRRQIRVARAGPVVDVDSVLGHTEWTEVQGA